jgi:hypothetical protein
VNPGVLDDVIGAAISGSDEAFSARDGASTVSVTVEHSVVTVYAAHAAVRRLP